jgi:hypothetical protein
MHVPGTYHKRNNMKAKILGFLAGGLLAFGQAVLAGVIVDTGTPNNPDPDAWLGATFRAGQFTIASTTRITGCERHLLPRSEGVADFRILSNSPDDIEAGQDMPGAPIVGLAATFLIPSRGSPEGWYGVSGFDWVLGPGKYWMVTSSENAFWRSDFCSQGDTACLPNALALEAVYIDPPDDRPLAWYPAGARTGWRLYGVAVPEPGTLALLALGLAGLGLSRRRKTH